jgi:hypothetical protein
LDRTHARNDVWLYCICLHTNVRKTAYYHHEKFAMVAVPPGPDASMHQCADGAGEWSASRDVCAITIIDVAGHLAPYL